MELRFISRDGDRLVFEAPDGTRHSALLEEDLKAAIRGNAAGTARVEISPKEIQSRLRHGESVDDLASEMGVPVSNLEPFAAPVLDDFVIFLTQLGDSNC